MAGFKTHITTSTFVGVGYAVGGSLLLGAELPTVVLAGGLCSVSGMLPDLDSDSGVPVREMTAFGAAVVPMLMMDRFRQMGMDQEMMVFVGGLIYAVVRFGVVEIFKKYTVHRGMWHSIPAAAVAGLLAFLVGSCEEMDLRLYKAGAVVAGFMTHLILDEIWSFEVKQGRFRLKKSFGTALKFWSRNTWANISVYAKLIVLAFLAVGDPVMMEEYGVHPNLLRMARQEKAAPSETPPADPNAEPDGETSAQPTPTAPSERLVPLPTLQR